MEEKTALRDMAIYIEKLLKSASGQFFYLIDFTKSRIISGIKKPLTDDLEQEYNVKGNEHYVDIPENRILVGVMRVGDFAKGFYQTA